jgi:hypothetical protein
VDVISFGSDKPRRPLPRPPRRAVVVGLAAAMCAVLVAGIVLVRRGGQPAPDAASPAAPSSAAPPSNAPSRPVRTAVPSAPPCPDAPEMTALVIDGVSGGWGGTLESCDSEAVKGPRSVVVRRHDGSLGSHGAVVTFPVAAPAGGVPVRVNGAAAWTVAGSVTWPLAKAYARVRGDLDQATLLAVAQRTTAPGGRPRVRPPAGYDVVWSGPYRATAVHEVRYGSEDAGEAAALGDGLTYTGVTSGGGGFEDQLYLHSTAGGLVGGVPTVLSQVAGGNATLAWELQPGMVAYVGYSGAALDDEAAAALRRLAARARLLSLADWWFSNPQTAYQVNEPG